MKRLLTATALALALASPAKAGQWTDIGNVKYQKMWNHTLRWLAARGNARENFECSYTTQQCKRWLVSFWETDGLSTSAYNRRNSYSGISVVQYLDGSDRTTVLGYGICFDTYRPSGNSYLCFDPEDGHYWGKDEFGNDKKETFFTGSDGDTSPFQGF